MIPGNGVRTRPPTVAIVGVLLAATIAVALSAMAIANSDTDLEGPATYLPIVAAVWLPAILGAVGLRHQKVLLAAGAACFPLSLLSLAGTTLPLLVPAVLYFFAYHSIRRRQSGAPSYTIAALGFALGISGMIPLLVSGGEIVCSKTILYPDGHKETERIERSEFGTLGSRRNGAQEVASACQQVAPYWAGALSLFVAASSVLLITYLGKSPTASCSARVA